MAQPWNLGPPVQDFTSLGNLGKAFTDAYDTSRKRALDEDKRNLLATAVQGGDLSKIGMGLIGAGDVTGGAALLQLGQKDAERKTLAEGIKSWSAPSSAPSAAPVAGPASLIQNESGGNWQAQNNAVGAGGAVGHFGRLQFGQARLQDAINAGALPPGTTPQAFMASPDLQKQAEVWHFNDIDQKIQQNGYDKLVGQSINGVPITIDGLRAVAHLGGTEGMKKFVASGGRYDPADQNGTRLSDYFARHGGAGSPTQVAQAPQGVPQPQGVQVAENEADVQRLEAQQAAQGQQPMQGRPIASIPGDDPIKLRQAAQAYAQTNPEAARQLNARADAAEARGVQVAQAAPQPGSPVADVLAQGAQPAQFVIPGGGAETSVLNDPKVKLWNERLNSPLALQSEAARAIAQRNLDISIKDAERRYNEGKAPESVREWQYALKNGLTTAKSPIEYAKEVAQAKASAPSSVQEYEYAKKNGFTGDLLAFQKAQAESKNQRQTTSDKVEENSAAADKLGLQGDDRKFFVANGRLPTAGEKVTEGQANAALYADRMRAADTILNKPEAIAAAQSRFQQIAGANSNVGSVLNSEQYKLYNQAKLDFITAKLRRESGAAISASEFEKDDKTFFPQPGDPPALIAQKAEARKRVIEGIGNAAGPSYAKRQAAAQEQATEKPAIPGGRVAPDGNTYVPDPNRPGKYLMVQP